ncbi:MAG: diversity-generating retroelement protein Avd [Candidatus Tectomicrobia bacterium]|uniref:Diversity-generating retroelement protein Avd n=1 Tax=Tectimicrobiota bacterium TaxID=2528274 RepID=A0A932CNM0_UNCTE|nr:diversity-generating retroelement protein Avd [Candidatus Tectomicrobia bacterium]
MTEELKVVTQTYDLVMWLLPQVSKFPRDYRFVLGDRIINGALDILELLVEASYERDKRELPGSSPGQALRRANLRLERLRYLVRVSKDLNLLSLRRYEYAAREINEVGTLLGGWIKQQQGRQTR